ncbi:hypothetical protein HYFRA_00000963 [Hymenoscyphus fraxineus]|uniref:SH3 domain-containing protein n=1 Tax=Hymenoscyphus fraxineus TaxID=746836 RepID=A0A9N9PR85_9HELO|nr:hypothetical protein HYFRA_00000963 [Hymenoscyphus fraxineus]
MASHGHFHRLHARRQVVEVEQAIEERAVSIVYVTAPATFDGPIGGYSTVGADEPPTPPTLAPAPVRPTQPPPAPPAAVPTRPAPAPRPLASVAPSEAPLVDDTPVPTPSAAEAPLSTELPTAINPPSITLSSSIAILAASSALSSPPNGLAATATGSSAKSSSTSEASTSDEGMSGGGKAGIVIGLLLLIGAILAIILYAFKRRKDANKVALADHEKQEDPFADSVSRAPSIRTNATAPRLSLRPVTQFIPNLMERRVSKGNALMTASAAPNTEKALPPMQMQRPDTNASNNSVNPFGDHARTIDVENANGAPTIPDMTTPVVESVANSRANNGAAVVAAAGTAAGAAAATGLSRGASKRGNGPKPMDFTKAGPFMGPPSPAGTDFSMSSDSPNTPTQTSTAAAIAAAGGPANSVVHRVQLDFKPSMDDELELRAGQLIRLLHEYDDGWALCIRLDRSKQGVVPRTCLSTRPVKPRPQQNSPRTPPQGRPMTPSGRMTPNGQPQPGNPNRPNGPNPIRSMTPTSPGSPPRAMTPSSQGQGRPQAPSTAQQQVRQNSPPGPTSLNPGNPPYPVDNNGPARPSVNAPVRKPVPGQAL